MNRRCSVCKHPKHPEMLVTYASTWSYRTTAKVYGVGYRSLQRHIKRCVFAILEDIEQLFYEQQLKDVAEDLRNQYSRVMRSKRKRSIIKKKVEFTWSRRAWKKRQKGKH